jgi:hypothetical protein
MNNDYETLIDMSKPMLDKLSHDKTLDQQDIDNTVQSLLPYLKTQGVYLSDEDVGKAVAELQYYYATTFTDEDALICDGTHKSTWWTDSSETRKQNKKNYYWDSYRSYLSKHEKYKADVISRIDERTDKVMNNLFDPSNRDITEARRRGMVIGSVQSGKTANYTALVAKAADAGYKIIIIIAGTTSLLRKQTQYRINCGFIGQTDLNKDEPDVVGENMSEENTVSKHRCSSRQEQERKRPFAMTTERMDGDFKSDSRRATQQTNLNNTTSPLIFVIKKNTTVLQQILDWFKGKDLSDQSLLLVDDEADNASVNTRRNTEEATAINKKIRLILNSFKKNAYVGFTATPFANIFIDPGFEKEDDEKDLYPSNFIFSLVSSGEYFGPERVFGPEEAEDSDYIKILPDDNAALDDWMGYFPPKQKKGITSKKIDGLPQTLKDAINLFIFNIWVRNKRGFENT